MIRKNPQCSDGHCFQHRILSLGVRIPYKCKVLHNVYTAKTLAWFDSTKLRFLLINSNYSLRFGVRVLEDLAYRSTFLGCNYLLWQDLNSNIWFQGEIRGFESRRDTSFLENLFFNESKACYQRCEEDSTQRAKSYPLLERQQELAGTQLRVLSIWSLGSGLVCQLPCLGDAIVVVGI